MLAYIREFVTEPRKAPLAGNTVGTDRAFLARDMPELEGWTALPRHRRLLHQGAHPPVVSRGPTSRPRQGRQPPCPGRHHREHRRAPLLPQGRVRGPARTRHRGGQSPGCRGRGRRAGVSPAGCVTLVLAVSGACPARVVGVAQLVEHRLVVPVAAGSSPVVHPREPLHTTFVAGVFPCPGTFSVRAGCRRNRSRHERCPVHRWPTRGRLERRRSSTSS